MPRCEICGNPLKEKPVSVVIDVARLSICPSYGKRYKARTEGRSPAALS